MPVEWGTVTFGAPAYVWLLAVPGALLGLWLWRLLQRTTELGRLRRARVSAVRERWSLAGDLPGWAGVIAASAAMIVALARPQAVTPGLARAGVDLVVLLDGSASMAVGDVPDGTRWSRATRFVRRLGDALRWDGDRLALTVFARIATPQVRLTRDPNTVFFFLDRLAARSPFRLEDEASWDTNVEQGIAWGLRLLEKDREIHGRSPNAPVFLLVSDGETWSGEVARGIDRLRSARIPLFVAGVGTLGGGRLPQVRFPGESEPPPATSHLDRSGLRRLAAEGQGAYFELDREADREIANVIVDAGRRLAAPMPAPAVRQDLHWPLLAGACLLAAAFGLFLQRTLPLALQVAGAAVAVVVAVRVLWL